MRDYKLKIAMVAPLWHRIPPKEYGGTERVVAALTEELAKKGHEVTLFATGDSRTSAKLFPSYPKGLKEARVNQVQAAETILQHVGNVYKMHEQFDVIHDHLDSMNLPAAQFVDTPVIITIHGPITPKKRKLYEMYDKPFYVPISHSQIKYFPNINSAGVVYNGLPMDNYPLKKTGQNYLLFVGRIAQVKGVHFAIDVAESLNLPLLIAAKLDGRDVSYFKRHIKPRLSRKIRWIGEVTQAERNNLMANALCLLNPITWKEPFGLTMIEAMACGCPVIAFNNGSVPEIVQDGKSGFVVKNTNEMIEAVQNIEEIDRDYCRKFSLEKFSSKVMADNYEEIYYKIFESELSIKDIFLHKALGIN